MTGKYGPNQNDACSEVGAKRIAAEIVTFWTVRGYTTVTAKVEPLCPTEYKRSCGKFGAKIYAVKTNLINGLPPRETA